MAVSWQTGAGSYGLSLASPIWKWYFERVFFKVDFHLLSSSVLWNVESWEAVDVLAVTQHTGAMRGQYHQLCSRHNTSKDNILVRWLSKSDLLNKVVLVMPHYLQQHRLFRRGFVQQCSVSPVIQACSLLVVIDTVSEVVQFPGFHVALNPATIRKS